MKKAFFFFTMIATGLLVASCGDDETESLDENPPLVMIFEKQVVPVQYISKKEVPVWFNDRIKELSILSPKDQYLLKGVWNGKKIYMVYPAYIQTEYFDSNGKIIPFMEIKEGGEVTDIICIYCVKR